MATKTIKLEVPFQKLLSVIDQLTPDEKLVLKKKLQREKVSTWQERFGRALQYLGKKNIKFSEKEVSKDVKRAIAEVRGIGCN
ncbi:MAG: hypothetical protein L6246_10400 [Thermodesulfovibrionales bacterium]|nr:hypothetical protein [Nitrospinota bacterium]MCG2710708.1 hypothetical protein [Thermodesulfovibrionales bacterium]